MIVEIITNLAPHYRSKLWKRLLAEPNAQFNFIFGIDSKSSIKQIDFETPEWEGEKARLKQITNYSFRGVLLWQVGVIRHCLTTAADVIILLDQVNIISNWIALAICLARGKKVCFWGHGVYGTEGIFKRRLRCFYLSFAHHIFVYGSHAKKLLQSYGFRTHRVSQVYNSLDHQAHVQMREEVLDSTFYQSQNFFSDTTRPVMVFIGRLTAHKRLDMLIDAVRSLSVRNCPANLVLIGDGPDRSRLVEMSRDLDGQVAFYGACYDERQIGKLVANADICVSPGEVGLTAIHALSFGTPVCTHDDFCRQMPEVEAVVSGKTGTYFSLTKANLAEVLETWFRRKVERDHVRRECYAEVDMRWNPDHQANVFVSVCRSLLVNAPTVEVVADDKQPT